MIFKDRAEAGRKLAEKLRSFEGGDIVIYALPRGGVVLGKEIAKALNKPLDLLVVRKVGHPLDEEYAVGAVAEDGHTIFSEEGKKIAKELEGIVQKERKEAERRRQVYTGGRSTSAKDKIAIIVDDGIATGLTMELAVNEIKHQNPKKVIVAVPVVPIETAKRFKKIADDLVAVDIADEYLGSVGAYYREFPQLTDEEVIKILKS